MEDMPEYIGDFSIRSVARSEDIPLEVNHSLLAQSEIDALRGEVQSLRYNLMLAQGEVARLKDMVDNPSINDRIKSERNEAISKYNNSIKIIRLLIKEIEQPAYNVDDVIDRMYLIENAKKLVE